MTNDATPNTDSIAKRVRALLAKADGGTTEGERKLLLKKAMELIASHKLDPSQYGEDAAEEIASALTNYKVSVLAVRGKMPGWIKMLANAAARATGCASLNTFVGSRETAAHLDENDAESLRLWESGKFNNKAIVAIGTERDRAVCRAIFDYLVDSCEKLAASYVRKMSAQKRDEIKKYGRAYTKPRTEGASYRRSYAAGVQDQVRVATEDSGLIVVDFARQAMNEMFTGLTKVSTRFRNNDAARAAGNAAHLGRDNMGGTGGSGGFFLGGG